MTVSHFQRVGKPINIKYKVQQDDISLIFDLTIALLATKVTKKALNSTPCFKHIHRIESHNALIGALTYGKGNKCSIKRHSA